MADGDRWWTKTTEPDGTVRFEIRPQGWVGAVSATVWFSVGLVMLVVWAFLAWISFEQWSDRGWHAALPMLVVICLGPLTPNAIGAWLWRIAATETVRIGPDRVTAERRAWPFRRRAEFITGGSAAVFVDGKDGWSPWRHPEMWRPWEQGWPLRFWVLPPFALGGVVIQSGSTEADSIHVGFALNLDEAIALAHDLDGVHGLHAVRGDVPRP